MAFKDDIKRFTLEINESKNNGETLKNIQRLETETAGLRKENEQLEKVMGYMASQGKKGTETYKQMEVQLKANRLAISQNSEVIKGLTKNMDLNYMSMNQLKKRATELKSTLNVMSKAANPEEYARLETELKQVGTQMDKLKGKADETKSFFGKLDGQLGKVGLSLPTLGWGAAAAGAVAAAKAVVTFVNETVKMRRQIGQLTGETGQDLADLTANIKATADTFQVGFDELSVASNNFAKSMGISNQAAMDLIDQGFVNGANASGEFLNMLSEYGPQLREAGYSAEEAISLMSQQVKAGVFTDKGIDVIKEASLRLREMPQSTRDALDGIGISSKEMMDKLAKGEITVSDAIQQVSQKMATLPPQSSAVGTAIADVFGGPGEDAGLQYILMLGEAGEKMDKLGEKTRGQMSTQELMLTSNKELQKSLSDLVGIGTGGFDRVKATAKLLLSDGIQGLITGFKTVRDWFIDLYNNSVVIRYGIQGFILTMKNGFEIIMLPVRQFFGALGSGAKMLKAVFTGNFKEIPELYKEFLVKSKDNVVNSITTIAGNVKSAWNKTLNGKIDPPTVDPEKQASEQKKQETKAYIQAKNIGAAAQKASDEIAKKALEKLENRQKIEMNTFKEALLNEGKTADEINKSIAKKEDEQLKVKISKMKELGMITSDLEQELLDRQLKAKEEFDKKTEEEKQNLLNETKKKHEQELKDLETSLKIKQELTKQDAIMNKLDEQQINALLLVDQDNYLKTKLAMQQEWGENTKETELEIAQNITTISANALKEDEERLKQLDDLKKKYLEEDLLSNQEKLDKDLASIEDFHTQGLISEKEYEKAKSKIKKDGEDARLEIIKKYAEAANTLLGVASDFYSARKDAELAKAGNNAEKKDAINKKYAKKEQTIAIGQALIGGALSVIQILQSKGTGNFILDGILKAIEIGLVAGTVTAQISKIKAQQFATGRYPVRGASDSQLYSASFVGRPRTGIYNKPSLGLFSEKQPEAVIDGSTTERLMWNYPHIWNGITTLAAGGVPQFANGYYPAGTPSNQSAVTQSKDNELINVVQQNNALMLKNAELLSHLKEHGVNTPPINAVEVFKLKDAYDSAVKASEY